MLSESNVLKNSKSKTWQLIKKSLVQQGSKPLTLG